MKTIFCLLLAHHLFTLLPRTCSLFALTHAVTWWRHCWTAHAWWHGLVSLTQETVMN